MQGSCSYDELVEIFRTHGGTPELYLSRHYHRFVVTLEEFCSTWPRQRGCRVLDVGAHWLHQAVLWRHAGFGVTAVDLPGTFEVESVKNTATALDIALLKCPDMEQSRELETLPDDSFDVVLFTEIIEHITFNPVMFWKQIYRVLAPGGRIVVTTPNYYSAKGRAWSAWRFLRGMGGGITVDEVLGVHTYGHHWREFSKAELLRYFALLSPDFVPVKVRLMPTYVLSSVRWKRLAQRVFDKIPMLRPNLHVEIELPQKARGIVAEPSW
jgi:2-polyprenyl-6-hydroxyphenyl methylase/3-demethylubiquinone-9 3-methyltransferase